MAPLHLRALQGRTQPVETEDDLSDLGLRVARGGILRGLQLLLQRVEQGLGREGRGRLRLARGRRRVVLEAGRGKLAAIDLLADERVCTRREDGDHDAVDVAQRLPARDAAHAFLPEPVDRLQQVAVGRVHRERELFGRW